MAKLLQSRDDGSGLVSPLRSIDYKAVRLANPPRVSGIDTDLSHVCLETARPRSGIALLDAILACLGRRRLRHDGSRRTAKCNETPRFGLGSSRHLRRGPRLLEGAERCRQPVERLLRPPRLAHESKVGPDYLVQCPRGRQRRRRDRSSVARRERCGTPHDFDHVARFLVR